LGCELQPDAISDSSGNPVSVPFPQCFNLRGNSGRNTLIGPGLTNLDFSIFKNNRIRRISENFNVQFRRSFSTCLNHANLSVPVTPDNTDIFDQPGRHWRSRAIDVDNDHSARDSVRHKAVLVMVSRLPIIFVNEAESHYPKQRLGGMRIQIQCESNLEKMRQ